MKLKRLNVVTISCPLTKLSHKEVLKHPQLKLSHVKTTFSGGTGFASFCDFLLKKGILKGLVNILYCLEAQGCGDLPFILRIRKSFLYKLVEREGFTIQWW